MKKGCFNRIHILLYLVRPFLIKENNYFSKVLQTAHINMTFILYLYFIEHKKHNALGTDLMIFQDEM